MKLKGLLKKTTHPKWSTCCANLKTVSGSWVISSDLMGLPWTSSSGSPSDPAALAFFEAFLDPKREAAVFYRRSQQNGVSENTTVVAGGVNCRC